MNRPLIDLIAGAVIRFIFTPSTTTKSPSLHTHSEGLL